MHTFTVEYDGSNRGDGEGEVTVLHSGDFSGDLTVNVPAAWVPSLAVEGTVVQIIFPFGVIEQIAAEHVRLERLNDIEQASWTDLLGLTGAKGY